MKQLNIILMASCILVLGACSSISPKIPALEKDKRSMVYGYIDMSEAPARLDYISLKQALPKIDKPYYSMRNFKVGEARFVFYREVPTRGSYQLSHFGGASRSLFSNTPSYSFSFPTGKNKTAVRTKKSGLYYLGSYKYVPIKGKNLLGFEEHTGFELKKIKKSKKELLKGILDFAQETKWDGIIQRAIKRSK